MSAEYHTPRSFVSNETEKPRERRRLGLRYGAPVESGFSNSFEANGVGGDRGGDKDARE